MGKPSARSSLSEKLLRRRVHETYGNYINELIDGLRAKYPEYRRQKPQLFTRLFKQTLMSDNNIKGKRKLSNRQTFDDDDNTSSSQISKKAKRKRLQSESSSSSEDGDEDLSAVSVE